MKVKNYQQLKFEVLGSVAHVTLNRPEIRNAFGLELISELSDVFTQLGGRHDLCAIVLRGAGKSFCAGADLNYMKAMAKFSREQNENDAKQLFDMFLSVRTCAVPTIAVLHGHVMGGGLGLAAAADISVAVDGTQFCFSEVKLGLIPAVISKFSLEKIQPSWARRFMLTAEIFDSSLALASGLVTMKGASAEVEAFVGETLSRLSSGGPEAIRACKKLIEQTGRDMDWSEARTMTAQLIASQRMSAEGQEGMQSFLEKRDPKWRSK